jgi:hypothetical protein
MYAVLCADFNNPGQMTLFITLKEIMFLWKCPREINSPDSN